VSKPTPSNRRHCPQRAAPQLQTLRAAWPQRLQLAVVWDGVATGCWEDAEGNAKRLPACG